MNPIKNKSDNSFIKAVFTDLSTRGLSEDVVVQGNAGLYLDKSAKDTYLTYNYLKKEVHKMLINKKVAKVVKIIRNVPEEIWETMKANLKEIIPPGGDEEDDEVEVEDYEGDDTSVSAQQESYSRTYTIGESRMRYNHSTHMMESLTKTDEVYTTLYLSEKEFRESPTQSIMYFKSLLDELDI